ncbi:MAG: DinB family protein [Acidimicrobiales bacterium]
MPIVPDDKDWTWVLERSCRDCGFDARDVAPAAIAGGLRANAAAWRPLLDHPAVAERPSDDRWSALEYACHVRDVFRLYDERLALMLEHDDPTFANWDQDVTAVEDRYREQDPAVVVTDLEVAGARLADSFAAVSGDQWQRTGGRSDGARFTVDSFARYLLHDPVHHIWDVEQGYEAIARG